MNLEELFSIKFILVCVIVVSILTVWIGISISNRIEAKAIKANAILKDIQQSRSCDYKKISSALESLVGISGSRG